MPTRVRILFLIDENVPDSVARFLLERGHDVRLARDELAAGAPDPVIAASADAVGAIVVTWNHKHFKKLANRASNRYPRLGLVSFNCSEARGRERIADVIDHIEFEYERSQGLSDTRVMFRIGARTFQVSR